MQVQFKGGYNNTYDYWCDEPVEIGKYCVVEVRGDLEIVKVVNIKDTSERASKWIVQVVDDHRYKLRNMAESVA